MGGLSRAENDCTGHFRSCRLVINNRRALQSSGRYFKLLEHQALFVSLVGVFVPKRGLSVLPTRRTPPSNDEIC
jgi:hypothetical protein